MTSRELKKIRKRLPANYLQILHDRTGFSTVYIWQVLNEKGRSNDKIYDAAINLAEEEKQKIEGRKDKVANL